MKKKFKLSVLATSLLVAALAASAADARLVTPQRWERVTVITTDGWEYPSVTVELVEAGQALRLVRPDGAQKTLPLDRIRELQDSIGRDITAHVIAGWSRRAEGPPPPAAAGPRDESSRSPAWWSDPGRDRDHHEGRWEPRDREWRGFREVARPEDGRHGGDPLATRFAVALGGAVGFGWNDGRWYQRFEDSEYYQGQIRLAISGAVYLTGIYRRTEMMHRPDLVVPPVDGLVVQTDRDLEIDQFLFGIGFMPRRYDWSDAIPFLELGFGRSEYTRVGPDGWMSDSTDERTVFAQVGLIMPLGRDVALELAGSAVHVGDDLFEFGENADSGTVLGVQGGLTFLLGMVE